MQGATGNSRTKQTGRRHDKRKKGRSRDIRHAHAEILHFLLVGSGEPCRLLMRSACRGVRIMNLSFSAPLPHTRVGG